MSQDDFLFPITANQANYPTMEDPVSSRFAVTTGPLLYFDYNSDYTVQIYGSDKRVNTPHQEIFNYNINTPNLTCGFGCSYDRLYFVYGDFPYDEPLVASDGRFRPYFEGNHVSVIGSGVGIFPDQ